MTEDNEEKTESTERKSKLADVSLALAISANVLLLVIFFVVYREGAVKLARGGCADWQALGTVVIGVALSVIPFTMAAIAYRMGKTALRECECNRGCAIAGKILGAAPFVLLVLLILFALLVGD